MNATSAENEKLKMARAKAAAILGRISSPRKAIAAQKNGKLGGRPMGSKNKRKYYANI